MSESDLVLHLCLGSKYKWVGISPFGSHAGGMHCYLGTVFIFSEIVLPLVMTRRPEGREFGGAGVSHRGGGVTLESSGEVVWEASTDDGSVGTRCCICSLLLELAGFWGGKGRNKEKEVGIMLTSNLYQLPIFGRQLCLLPEYIPCWHFGFSQTPCQVAVGLQGTLGKCGLSCTTTSEF